VIAPRQIAVAVPFTQPLPADETQRHDEGVRPPARAMDRRSIKSAQGPPARRRVVKFEPISPFEDQPSISLTRRLEVAPDVAA
jgi:hypothetical protein